MKSKLLHIDSYLVSKAKLDDEVAFKELYEKYANSIFGYVKSLVKTDTHAEEIVQDVFMKVWLKRTALNPELSFKSYVFTIAKNLSFNFLAKAANDNKLKQEVFYHLPKSHSEVEQYMLDKDFEKLERSAIDRLPPKRRRIFEMSRKEGKSYNQISTELGITTQTVKNQISTALSNISGYLESTGEISLIVALFHCLF